MSLLSRNGVNIELMNQDLHFINSYKDEISLNRLL